MPYTPRQLEVLTKYKILLPDGSRRMCDLKKEGPEPLGPGPLLGDDALEALLAADTTPDGMWLDWVFYQAGGGLEAEDKRAKSIEEIKVIYYKERLEGFSHPVDHRWVPPRPREEVDSRWERALPTFTEMMQVADQDAVIRMTGTFGYYRSLPGRSSVYTNVIRALTSYLDVADKAAATDAGEATPDNTPSWQRLADKAKAVIRFYASKDVRYAGVEKHENLVYSDEVLDVMVPLTYPASVKYGHSGWGFSNPKTFKQAAAGEKLHYDWRNAVSGERYYAFISFKVPVPGWVTSGKQYWLTNLALELPQGDLSADTANPDEVYKVWDEENHFERSIGDVKEMIRSEPARQRPPDDNQPIMTGAPTVTTPEQAEYIIQHLDAALEALRQWSKEADWTLFSPDLSKMPR